MGEENVRGALLKKKYYENCPGCKVDQAKELNPNLSIKNLLIVWMMGISCSLPNSSLYPYLYFMVRDFNIAKTEANISTYAGYVGSSLMLGRTLTSVLWGIIADRYGRKPVLVIGVISTLIFNTLFGLSTSYWMAIILRFLVGSLCGVFGPLKAYACELFREEHQAISLSTISGSYAIAFIIGPAIGGYLSQPVEKYPHIFLKGSFLDKFPYFLPCIIISVFAFATTIFCIWIPETLHNHNDGNKSKDEAKALVKEDGGTEIFKKIPKNVNLLLNWPLMASILAYGLYSLYDIAFQEVFSLWAVSPTKLGGLSFTTNDVGNFLSISGVAVIIYQIVAYTYIEKTFGTMTSTRIAGVLAIPLVQSFPFIGLCFGISLYILISIGCVLKMILSMTISTGLFLIQNRVVEQHQRGEANGIAMTVTSLLSAIGPALGGAVLSWSQTRMNASFLPGTHMVFFVLNVISAIGMVMLIALVRDKKKTDSDEQN